MDFITLLFISFGLAMDAFSVALTDGIIIKKIKLHHVIKISSFFGVFQFAMLMTGFYIAGLFSKQITMFDHWIAFFLLIAIGGNMIYESYSQKEKNEQSKDPLSFMTLTVLAVATSIDALAVGVSFVALDVNILFSASVVGIVAFALSFAGVYIGNKCGNFFGDRAEIIGGVILILIAFKILIQELLLI